MPRTRNETRVAKARVLASQGKTQREVAAELGVPLRTLQSWPIKWPMGRPRVDDEHASARTARRRRSEQGLPGAESQAVANIAGA